MTQIAQSLNGERNIRKHHQTTVVLYFGLLFNGLKWSALLLMTADVKDTESTWTDVFSIVARPRTKGGRVVGKGCRHFAYISN